MQIKYSYGTKCCPIRVWASHMSIRIWDVTYAYGPIYAYGAEHIHPEHEDCRPRGEGVCIRQTTSALVTTNNIPLSYRVHQPANKVRNMKPTIPTRQYSLGNKYNFEMISKSHFSPPFKRYNRPIVHVYTIAKSFNSLHLMRPLSHNCIRSSVHS